MRWMKWIGIAAAILLIISCFIPWVFIESKNITVSGIDATGTRFGKPGYFHLLMSIFFLLFSCIQKLWAKRANLLVTALNLGWAIRNYIIISTCIMGDCPLKKAGIFILIPASLLMLISAVFPDMKLPEEKEKKWS
jgi:di/tricarboxylate transporter